MNKNTIYKKIYFDVKEYNPWFVCQIRYFW